MKNTGNDLGTLYEGAPFSLQFRPVHGHAKDIWTIHFESDMLTLMGAGHEAVLKLHRDEAARYMRFTYDLVRGRTYTFVIIEGVKSYTFQCNKQQLASMLAWLPHKEPAQDAREIRRSGCGVMLFGALHFVLLSGIHWFLGAGLLVLGLLGLAAPRRALYAVNGLGMILVGLCDLYPWRLSQDNLVGVLVGSLLIMWGVQQIAMLGPNHQLRVARSIRDHRASFLPRSSRICQTVGWCNLAAGILFGLYAIVLAVSSANRAPTRFRLGGIYGVLPDVAVYGGFALLFLVAAFLLVIRRQVLYFEAKTSAQMLVAVLAFTVCGIALAIRADAGGPILGGVFDPVRRVWTSPYVWGIMTVIVVAFNRWYVHEVDHELEEKRSEG